MNLAGYGLLCNRINSFTGEWQLDELVVLLVK